MILCDGNYVLGAYGMDSVHNREPERSWVTIVTNIVDDTPHIILDKIDTHSLNGFSNYLKLFLQQTCQYRPYVYCTNFVYVFAHK